MLYYSALSLVILLIPCVWADCPPEREQTRHNEIKLHSDLLCAYKKDMRPVNDRDDSINVKVRFVIKYITFDTMEKMITLHSWVVLKWNDVFLTWIPNDYGDIKETQFQYHEIWTPSMALYNIDTTGNYLEDIYTTCLVKYNGQVACVLRIAHTAICNTSLRQWPYDLQNCTLYFGSRYETIEQVNYTFYNVDPVILGDFHNGPGWKLLNAFNEYLPSNYNSYLNSSYPMLKYTFILKREAAGLAAIVVAPAVILVLVTLSSLLLGVKDCTRLMLLCFSLCGHMTLIREIGYVLPKLRIDTPIILLFVRDSMVINLSAILLTLVMMCLRKQVGIAPAWIMFINRLINFAPAKYIFFTGFNTTYDTQENKVGEDSGNREKSLRIADDWIKFSSVLTTLAFAISVLIYVVLMGTYIPSDD